MVNIKDLKSRPIDEPDRPWIYWSQALGLQAASLAITFGAIAIPFDSPYRPIRMGLRLVSIAGAIASVAKLREIDYLSKYWAYREVMREDAFLEAQALQVHGQFQSQPQLMPAAMVEAVDNPTAIQWGDVLSSPHLGIVGKTGSGKSALTQWLASQLQGEIVVYDSDAAPHEWEGLQVVGRGANYEMIAAAMEQDLIELQTRTEARARGDESFKPIIRILEESPETLSALKDNGFDIGYRWLKGILRRGRKYGIKLILLSQGFSVRSLRIEGEGELRDNIAVLRLGKVALAHAKSNCKDYQYELLKQQPRPILLEEDLIGSVPDLSAFLQRSPVAHSPHTESDLDTARIQLESLYSLDIPPIDTRTQAQDTCPSCGSNRTKGNGNTDTGKIRKRCKDCGRSWTIS